MEKCEPASWSTEQLRAYMRRAVARMAPSFMRDDVDDIVQTATIRALEVLELARGKREIKRAYLDRIAHGCLVDELRRAGRRASLVERSTDEERDASDMGSPQELERGEQADPERAFASREIGRAIASCLETLVPSRRRAVTLRLLGHSVPEIARLLGGALKAVEALVYRGLADLRACLVSKGVGPEL